MHNIDFELKDGSAIRVKQVLSEGDFKDYNDIRCQVYREGEKERFELFGGYYTSSNFSENQSDLWHLNCIIEYRFGHDNSYSCNGFVCVDFDRDTRRFSCSLGILKSSRRKNIATLGMYGIVKYCFEDLGMEKMTACCYEGNTASIHLHEKWLNAEGFSPEYGWNGHERVGLYQFGATKKDYDDKKEVIDDLLKNILNHEVYLWK